MSVKAQTSIRMERALQDTARFRTGAMKQYSHLSIITKYLFRLFMSGRMGIPAEHTRGRQDNGPDPWIDGRIVIDAAKTIPSAREFLEKNGK